MRDCRRIRHLIGSYVYNDLAAAERAIVAAHLRQCQRCRDEFTSTRELIRGIPADLLEPPAQAEERVLSSLTAQAMSRARVARRVWAPVWLALAGVALLVLGIWIGYELRHSPLSTYSRGMPIAAAPEDAATPAAPAPTTEPPAAPPEVFAEPGAGAEKPAAAGRRESEWHSISPLQVSEPVRIRAPQPLGLDDVTLAAVAPD